PSRPAALRRGTRAGDGRGARGAATARRCSYLAGGCYEAVRVLSGAVERCVDLARLARDKVRPLRPDWSVRPGQTWRTLRQSESPRPLAATQKRMPLRLGTRARLCRRATRGRTLRVQADVCGDAAVLTESSYSARWWILWLRRRIV